MALFQVRVKMLKVVTGKRIEPGMSVQVSTMTTSNPTLSPDGKRAINEAFIRVHGIDLNKANALNSSYLEAIKIG